MGCIALYYLHIVHSILGASIIYILLQYLFIFLMSFYFYIFDIHFNYTFQLMERFLI